MRIVQVILGVVLVGGLIATIWFMLTAPTTLETPAPKAAKVEPAPVAATNVPPPDTIVFDNKYGKVTFTHKTHYERVQGDCSMCHPAIFQQARVPINYGKALHRAAEATGTACAACHRVGGTSFAADSNCVKCHEVKQ